MQPKEAYAWHPSRRTTPKVLSPILLLQPLVADGTKSGNTAARYTLGDFSFHGSVWLPLLRRRMQQQHRRGLAAEMIALARTVALP